MLSGIWNIIKNFKYQTLRDYYHKWYRPDLQAIAVVGDFDVDQMEKKVKELFSKIPTPVNPAKREDFTVNPHDDIYFVCATDKEVNSIVRQRVYQIPGYPERRKRIMNT